jgi:acyl-CoA-binding protein
MSIELKFKAAVDYIKSASSSGSEVSLTNGEMLKFYGLFKQATEG